MWASLAVVNGSSKACSAAGRQRAGQTLSIIQIESIIAGRTRSSGIARSIKDTIEAIKVITIEAAITLYIIIKASAGKHWSSIANWVYQNKTCWALNADSSTGTDYTIGSTLKADEIWQISSYVASEAYSGVIRVTEGTVVEAVDAFWSLIHEVTSFTTP